MKCCHCKTELICGGNHDIEEEDTEFSMVTNFSCPKCGSVVWVYSPKQLEEDDVNINWTAWTKVKGKEINLVVMAQEEPSSIE